MSLRIQCQCPTAAVDHGPGQCGREAWVQVQRGPATLFLCTECDLPDDVELASRTGRERWSAPTPTITVNGRPVAEWLADRAAERAALLAVA